MPEVEKLAFLLVELIDFNEPLLRQEGVGNERIGPSVVTKLSAVEPKLEVLVERRITACEADLDGLGEPCDLARERHRGQERRIDEDRRRWIDVADEILDAFEIDRALATNAGIGHRHRGCGHVEPG